MQSWCPASSRREAIGPPMRPTPMKPSTAIVSSARLAAVKLSPAGSTLRDKSAPHGAAVPFDRADLADAVKAARPAQGNVRGGHRRRSLDSGDAGGEP